jgi:hypothetical protein
MGERLLWLALPQTYAFAADAFYSISDKSD